MPGAMNAPLAPPPAPPLLLTKRLTAFLHANLSAHIHTAALTTAAGKLLAHASAAPASTLRRQCAVAASLWALHAPESSRFSESAAAAAAAPAPASESTSSASTVGPDSRSQESGSGGGSPSSVTVQLDSGAVFVIRHLQCGMLFVCIGGNEPGPAHGAGPTTAEAGGSNPTATSPPLGSPSEAGSNFSAATTGVATATSQTTAVSSSAGLAPGAVLAMRRQVEELAKWLDERLGTLSVPEEGIGNHAGSAD